MTHLKGEGTDPKGLRIGRMPDGRVSLGGYTISSDDWELAKEAAGDAPKVSTKQTRSAKKAKADAASPDTSKDV